MYFLSQILDLAQIPFSQRKSLNKSPILLVDPRTLAEQLTLTASTLYKQITSSECETWQLHSAEKVLPPEYGQETPHINSMIDYSNSIHAWTRYEITTTPTQRDRIQVTEHLVDVASICRDLNDFTTLMAVISALMSEEAGMKQIREHMHAKYRARLVALHAMVGPKMGFLEYRQVVRNVDVGLPCVPCLGSLRLPFLCRTFLPFLPSIILLLCRPALLSWTLLSIFFAAFSSMY